METPVTVHGSGRTDRGVHALGQVGHIELGQSVSLPRDRWQSMMNERLPDNIGIYNLQDVGREFHARHSACYRVYGYRFILEPAKAKQNFHSSEYWSIPARKWNRRRFRWFCSKLNEGIPTRMFSGRGGSEYDSEHWPITTCIRYRNPCEIWILVGARSFRYQMVRCIAGALKRFACGRWEKKQIQERLKRRKSSFAPAPPDGCYLLDVQYQKYTNRYRRPWNRVLKFF